MKKNGKTATAALAAAILALSAGAASADCGTAHASSGEKSTMQQTSATAHESGTTRPDIVETAIGAGSFQTLVAAVQAAGLASVLQGEGPFTVFAPTDEAFAKLPEGTVEDLLKPENKEKLTAILTYHVVPGRITSAEVAKATTAKTVQGQELTVRWKDGKVWIDGASVAKADVEAENGVIHVIDAVLLPKM